MRAAEERYEKTKQAGASALHDTKETGTHGLAATTAYLAAKGTEAKDTAVHGPESLSRRELQPRIMLQRRPSRNTMLSFRVSVPLPMSLQRREGFCCKGYYNGEGSARYDAAKDTAVLAAVKAKDVTVGAGESAADYANQAAKKARDVTVSTGKSAVDYAQQAGVKAKDVAVETGKSAVDYAQQAAAKAKDATVSTGKSAAEYARETAVRAKDAAAGAGHKAMEHVGQKAGEAKVAAGGTGQRTKELEEQLAEKAKAKAQESNDPKNMLSRDLLKQRY